MDRKDWLLLSLDAAGERGLGPVQLQKALFIFGEEMKKNGDPTFFGFRPYDYGPFDAAVYSVAEAAEGEGLVGIRASPKSRRQYCITARGRQAAAGASSNIPERERAYMKTVVEWVQSKSFEDLLRAVYQKYPAMAVNALFRGARETACSVTLIVGVTRACLTGSGL